MLHVAIRYYYVRLNNCIYDHTKHDNTHMRVSKLKLLLTLWKNFKTKKLNASLYTNLPISDDNIFLQLYSLFFAADEMKIIKKK